MNENTKNFSNIDGKLAALCNISGGDLKAGYIYLIKFEKELTFDGKQFVKVYHSNGAYFCRCNCERFTLLCEVE